MTTEPPQTCPVHGEGCVGFVWCRICETQVNVHTHSHSVADYQAHDEQVRKPDYYDPARQDRISEHDCTFEDGQWWFGHGMPCKHPELHAAEPKYEYRVSVPHPFAGRGLNARGATLSTQWAGSVEEARSYSHPDLSDGWLERRIAAGPIERVPEEGD